MNKQRKLPFLTRGTLIGGACLSCAFAPEPPILYIVFLFDDMELKDTSF